MKLTLYALCLLLSTSITASPDEPLRIVGQVAADEDGSPLPGATVYAMHDAAEAVTDSEGRYAIRAAACDTLVFRFVTYQEQAIPVAGRRRIDVRMRVDKTGPDSVVVRTWIKPAKR